MPVRLINKYDAEQICDECGAKSVITRSAYNYKIKQDRVLCRSCNRRLNPPAQPIVRNKGLGFQEIKGLGGPGGGKHFVRIKSKFFLP